MVKKHKKSHKMPYWIKYALGEKDLNREDLFRIACELKNDYELTSKDTSDKKPLKPLTLDNGKKDYKKTKKYLDRDCFIKAIKSLLREGDIKYDVSTKLYSLNANFRTNLIKKDVNLIMLFNLFKEKFKLGLQLLNLRNPQEQLNSGRKVVFALLATDNTYHNCFLLEIFDTKDPNKAYIRFNSANELKDNHQVAYEKIISVIDHNYWIRVFRVDTNDVDDSTKYFAEKKYLRVSILINNFYSIIYVNENFANNLGVENLTKTIADIIYSYLKS